MRRTLLAAIIASLPSLAFADATVAGNWQADLGHGVIISMDLLADGYWTSETIQNDQVVAQLAGTYQQTATSPTSGQMTFVPTPNQSKTSGEHPPATTEIDTYKLDPDKHVLTLVTGGETMEFHQTLSNATQTKN